VTYWLSCSNSPCYFLKCPWLEEKEVIDNLSNKRIFKPAFVCGVVLWLLFCALSRRLMWPNQGHLAACPVLA